MARAHASNWTLALALALFAVPGFASEFDVQLAEAERLRAEAAEAGYEWLETAMLLEQARDAAAIGNLDDAIAFVEEAHFQAVAAIQQAEREADAWRKRVVR
jgi:hypothetical protein